MKYSASVASLLGLIAGAKAGTTIWSGSFNSYPTVSDFDNCKVLPLFRLIELTSDVLPLGSWSDEVGEYQWVSVTFQYTRAMIDLLLCSTSTEASLRATTLRWTQASKIRLTLPKPTDCA